MIETPSLVEVVTTPVADKERLEALDLLRGVAVLGILLVNMPLFAMPDAASVNPYALGTPSTGDLAIWSAIAIVAEGKFITLFSLLFGAGIILMTRRLEQRGVKPARVHYRRMVWLLAFALVHAYLLWHGDILVVYAVTGMLVYPARRLSSRALALVGVVVLALAMASSLTTGLFWEYGSEEMKAEWLRYWQPSADEIAAETAAFRGGWLAQESWRAGYSAAFHLEDMLAWDLWHVGGLMLLGMALLKFDVLTGRKAPRQYARLAMVGLGAGFPLAAWGVSRYHAVGWRVPDSLFFIPLWNYWGSLLVALGYSGLLLMLWKVGVMRGFMSRLLAIGRTAFSCYILETVICTTIFYGHGLGLFGTVSRLEQLLLTVAVWIVLLLLAPGWLRRFRYGPLEWLWRSLTYGQAMPMRGKPEVTMIR